MLYVFSMRSQTGYRPVQVQHPLTIVQPIAALTPTCLLSDTPIASRGALSLYLVTMITEFGRPIRLPRVKMSV